MNRYLKAIVPSIATFVALLVSDPDLVDSLNKIWESVVLSVAEGGMIYLTPNLPSERK